MNKKASLVVCAVSIAVFALLAVFYAGLLDLNIRISEIVQSLISPPLTVFMIAVTNLAEWYSYAVIGIFLIILPKTRMNIGIPAAATLIASALLNSGIKRLFALPRPDVNRLVEQSGYTFPSGHSMNCAAFYTVCVILLFGILKSKKAKAFAVAAASLFVLLVGFSRVYLGVHYAIDVAAGYMCGITLACAAQYITRRVYGKSL